jgi:probable phosphoglycerate mutase
MVQIVLIRPGATDYDEQGRIQGTLDIPLNERGAAAVQRVSDELRGQNIAALYAPPGKAAWQTATAISAALGVRARRIKQFQNLDHGLWQGLLIDDVKRKQPKVYRQWQEQPDIICPPEGEMLAHARERVQTAINKLLKKHKNEVVGLVVPEPLATVLQSYLEQTDVGDLWKGGSSCGSWEVISVEPATLVPSVS